MKVLVLGGTGTVGSQVAKELLQREVEVDILTRDPGRPVAAGARAVAGDLLDPATIRSAFKGVDGVFLLNAVSTTECHEGLMAVNGAMLADVARLVYLSVPALDQAPHLPHFGSKVGIEAAVRASGLRWTILRPNNFYQNDYWFKQALIEHGVYPQPIGGMGISRVDVRDIAEAAAICLTQEGHDWETYELAGPEALTGEATAAIWAEALGRPVSYAGDDLDAWEQQMSTFLPVWMAFDFRRMYEYFQREGFTASEATLARQSDLIGHRPRAFADFARETAALWQG